MELSLSGLTSFSAVDMALLLDWLWQALGVPFRFPQPSQGHNAPYCKPPGHFPGGSSISHPASPLGTWGLWDPSRSPKVKTGTRSLKPDLLLPKYAQLPFYLHWCGCSMFLRPFQGPSGWMGQRLAWFHLCSHPSNTCPLVSKMWAQHGIKAVHWSGGCLPSPSHNPLARRSLSRRHLPWVITSSIPKWHLSCPLSWNHNDWWSRVRKNKSANKRKPKILSLQYFLQAF